MHLIRRVTSATSSPSSSFVAIFATRFGSSHKTSTFQPLSRFASTTSLSQDNIKAMDRQQRQRLVVVGSGWVGLYLAQYIDTDKYHVSIISPNRTSPYTPLLASAAVALIPFRYAEESIRSKGRDVRFLEANVTEVDLESKSLRCEAAFEGEDPLMKERGFELAYDKLVLAPGCTFVF